MVVMLAMSLTVINNSSLCHTASVLSLLLNGLEYLDEGRDAEERCARSERKAVDQIGRSGEDTYTLWSR